MQLNILLRDVSVDFKTIFNFIQMYLNIANILFE